MDMIEFLNGLRVLWNIDMRQYLSCINAEDRDYFGDNELWEAFRKDPHKTFANLPDEDQRRVFAIITERNSRIHPALRENDYESSPSILNPSRD